MMAAGTISLNIQSKIITGSETNFIDEVKANDFIVVVVGGVTYTLGITDVISDTSLTLNTEYNGPSTSGLTWTPVPAQTLIGITAQIAADTARAIRGLNLDKANWQQVFSATSNTITVNLPDGSCFSGPAWGQVTASLNNVTESLESFTASVKKKANAGENSDITALKGLKTPLTLKQGGTGALTSVDARKNLGLGSAATATLQSSYEDTGEGKVLTFGAFGLGAAALPMTQDFTNRQYTGFYKTPAVGGSLPAGGANYLCQSLLWDKSNKVVTGFRLGGSLRYFARALVGGSWQSPVEFYTTVNTTVDTNNFIKKASPIARLSDSPATMESGFTAGGFVLAGLASVNTEAEGVHADKIGPGVYRVTGVQGLSVEGWTIEGPQDHNGNRLCFIKTDTATDGEITVHVFSRKFDVSTASIVAGEPMDIPCGRWIDLRLQMPLDSAWNKRTRELANTSYEAELA